MKILIYSDSHNNSKAIEKIKSIINDYDKVLFLGDGVSDFKEITKGYEGEALAVLGNCDFSSEYPMERIVEIDGVKIFMCHGHRYNVKMSLNSILYKGEEAGAEVILFGHSHTQILEHHMGIYVMNPGSVSHSYIGKIGYGVLEIEEGLIKDIYLKQL